MAVDLDHVAERVFAVDHAVGLLPRIVMPDLLHALTAAILLDELNPPFKIGILNAEMEDLRPPVFKGLFLGLGLWELEELDTDAVAGRQMRDPERPPAFPEDVIAHLSDGAFIVIDRGRPHDLIEPERLGIEFDRSLEVWDGDADVAETGGRRHAISCRSEVLGMKRLTSCAISLRHISMP